MRDALLQTWRLGLALVAIGCTSQDDLPASAAGAGGGVNATGGTAAVVAGSAGHGATGMSSAGSGGGSASPGGVGGGVAGGSTANAAGDAGRGGVGAAAGGTSALGGKSSMSGGAAGAGGEGGSSSAGQPPMGGRGGESPFTGGRGSAAGGRAASGGAAGAGLAGAAGAPTDPPCPPSTPLTGGKQVCGTMGDGTADGSYSYNLWSDGMGMGCMTVYGVDAAFKATWMNVGDWIGRIGRSFDSTKTYDKLGTFSSDFAYTMTGITSGGFGNIGIYGWTLNELHEFYIAENWLGKKPNFTKVGSFTIDGEGTYDIMTNQQKNQPNITGKNQDFVQFWSVRSSPRQCGHISISKHFDEWKSLGLNLGNLEEVRILVEAQNNSGTLDFTEATVVVN